MGTIDIRDFDLVLIFFLEATEEKGVEERRSTGKELNMVKGSSR
jgi:hypothetical protein